MTRPIISMVAGETSGDMLAARLLSGLRPQLPTSLMHGIGGQQMADYGFVSDFPMEKLSVRGLFEVLMHYREISGIRNNLKQQLLLEKPDVFIGVDAKFFMKTKFSSAVLARARLNRGWVEMQADAAPPPNLSGKDMKKLTNSVRQLRGMIERHQEKMYVLCKRGRFSQNLGGLS